jgi:molybdopterin molybdotransferase
LKGFQKLTSVDQALKAFLKTVPLRELRICTVSLPSALDRVLREDIVAMEDLPPFDRSAVDGYAVKANDTVGASQFRPRSLKIINEDRIRSKQAVQVWTGNPIPTGADAAVMLENTESVDDEIEIWVPLTPGENVSKKGEDMPRGKTALEAGIRLRPHHLALMAALGRKEVKVSEAPIIAVLATGNELAEASGKRHGNQIFDSNRILIASMLRELGAEPLDLGIVRDNTEDIAEKLREAIGEADGVISTGGTSVGAGDLVPEAVDRIGKPGILIHGIAIRPGMPTALAVAYEKPLLILSGNPVAAIVGFEIFARPLICRMLGLKETEQRPIVQAKITKRANSALGRKTFLRVRVYQGKDGLLAEPISAKGSGLISTMTKGNGYVVVPESQEGLEEGETVTVNLFDSVRSKG